MQFTRPVGHRLKRAGGSPWAIAANLFALALGFAVLMGLRSVDLATWPALALVLTPPVLILLGAITIPDVLLWGHRRGDPRNGARLQVDALWLLPAVIGLLGCGGYLRGLYGLEWLWIGLVPAIPYALVVWLFCAPSAEAPVYLAVILAVGAYLYGFAAIAVANEVFDSRTTARVQTHVADLWVTHGRGRSHHALLDPSPGGPKLGTVLVRPKEYKVLAQTRRACVVMHPGAFGLPWYALEPGGCQPA